MAMMAVSGQWTRVRTLGRGASGAEVFLAADDVSGELFAVKASAGAAGAEGLRREQGVMAGLRCPRLVSSIGGRGGRDGSYQLFLEFAPGGSVADEVARCGGRLEERAVRGYAADVAAGLAYLHGMGLVHGDVKARNVVIGGDGRAKLADFGCSRWADSRRPIGGTPAFMAPEVARGEEQGPAADVWALGCTVVEMATGRTPWSDMGDALAALHRIGYTEAVPEVPQWLSPEAKDFVGRCFARRPNDRSTAAHLLEHPFLASAGAAAGSSDAKLGEAVKTKWVSPKSTLDAAFWESDADEADDDLCSHSTAERIRAMACPASSLPDWDSDEGWIEVISAPTEASDEVAPTPTYQETTMTVPADADARNEESSPPEEAAALVDDADTEDTSCDSAPTTAAESDDDSLQHDRHHHHQCSDLLSHELPPCTCKPPRNRNNNAIDFVVPAQLLTTTATSHYSTACCSVSPSPCSLRCVYAEHGSLALSIDEGEKDRADAERRERAKRRSVIRVRAASAKKKLSRWQRGPPTPGKEGKAPRAGEEVKTKKVAFPQVSVASRLVSCRLRLLRQVEIQQMSWAGVSSPWRWCASGLIARRCGRDGGMCAGRPPVSTHNMPASRLVKKN